MSLVIRVIIIEVPASSISVKDKDSMCLNTAWRSFVAKPTAAFAAKYCAVIEQVRPIAARISKSPPIFQIYGASFWEIPRSISHDITNGTVRSKHASSNLNNGPRIHSFRYSVIYFNNFFIRCLLKVICPKDTTFIVSCIFEKNNTLHKKDSHNLAAFLLYSWNWKLPEHRSKQQYLQKEAG